MKTKKKLFFLEEIDLKILRFFFNFTKKLRNVSQTTRYYAKVVEKYARKSQIF
jgi:hypothetical protein